jgi:chemotaxis protein CheD
MTVITKTGVPALPRTLKGFTHIKRYWDRTRNCYAAKILPGEYYVTTHKEVLTTVLGSCVSACIRDPVFGIGGMNHFMLPKAKEGTTADDWRTRYLSAETRYGSFAMEQLINDIQKHGGVRNNLEVKVVGGGRILASMTDIGRRNIEFVRDYLAIEGLSIAGEDLGDIYPRKVLYYPLSGKVQVKKLRSLHNKTIVDRETHYLEDLDRDPAIGEVELF